MVKSNRSWMEKLNPGNQAQLTGERKAIYMKYVKIRFVLFVISLLSYIVISQVSPNNTQYVLGAWVTILIAEGLISTIRHESIYYLRLRENEVAKKSNKKTLKSMKAMGNGKK